MSGAGLIEMLAARLARRAPREAAPELRQVLQSRMLRPEDIGDATRRDLSTWGPRGVAGDEILDRPIQVTPTSVDDLLASNPQFLEDPERAAEFAARSTPLPPVMMRGGKLIDGRHRLEAARIRGNDTIDAVDLDQFERPSAPSLRSALSEVNAKRTGPDAGPVQGENAPRRMADGTVALDQYMPNHGEWTEPMETALRREVQANRFVEQEVPITDLTTTQQSVFPHFAQTIDNRGGHGLPIVYRTQDGRLLLVDGHHRAAANAASGNGSLRVRVYSEPARTAPDGGPVQAGNRPEVEVRRLDSGTYEARVDGKRVGGIVIDQRSDAPHVFNVNVDPEFRRQGVATALYQAAERDLGRPLAPSASQSDDALAFWNNYRPEAVADDLRAHKNALIGQTVETRYGPAVIENVVSHQAVGRLASGGTTAVSRTQLEPLLARTGPNAGSDRNALQRALRERMNRE